MSNALTKARVDNLRAVIGAGGNASNLPMTLSLRVADPGPYLASNCAAVSGCCLRYWIASEATSTRGQRPTTSGHRQRTLGAGIPSAIRNYLAGRQFTLADEDGISHGTVKISDEGMSYGLGSFLRQRGADEGDILVAEFDLGAGAAVMRLGDDELLDELVRRHDLQTHSGLSQCGGARSASDPLPVSISVNSATTSKPSASANRATAARWASMPSPERPCSNSADPVLGDVKPAQRSAVLHASARSCCLDCV